MPIPPSIDLALVAVEHVASSPECPDGCVFAHGGPGATAAFARVVVHRIGAVAADDPFVGTGIADGSGAFEIRVPGGPEVPFRVIVAAADGSAAADFIVVTDAGPGPWPVEPYVLPPSITCFGLAAPEVTFADVRAGTAATSAVEIRNDCGAGVDLLGAAAPYEPAGADPPVFEVVARAGTVLPGTSSAVVVSFWPVDPEQYAGALLVIVGGLPDFDIVLFSVPVRGSGIPR